MKNYKFTLSLSAIALLFLFSCNSVKTDLSQTPFIPKPVSVTATGQAFKLENTTAIFVQEGLEQTGKYLAESLGKIAGATFEVKTSAEVPASGIYLSLSAGKPELGNEGYELVIGKNLIEIKANQPAGCFNGIQTLLQTLPVKTAEGEIPAIATGTVTDYPDFAFRGSMLDVARHFFSVDEVKQYIDFLAAYKMNILHLHLSDDQGWRIEIKSWPKLIEIGGSTEVGGGAGGFYTQEQYTELVNYALERNITIIPEIDMPGHTNAALASYAELNKNDKATELYTGTEVGFSTLWAKKEVTYQFIDDVVREISAISPGPWFHIGGDESHVTDSLDYIVLINRAQEIVTKYGKKVIGWDEIANATPVTGATVQFWADVENTTKGLEKGAKVLISPASKAYLDMQYDPTTHLGLHWAGYIEVDKGYSWSADTLVPGLTKDKILGIEAPIWSETVTNIDEVEYMVFPRLPGYAEIGWTAPANRNWEEYKLRLAKHGKRFEAKGIDYYKSKLVPWE
ncbi:MAG: beta-N-acetylhexosaminidase [Draconibacterium sp.]